MINTRKWYKIWMSRCDVVRTMLPRTVPMQFRGQPGFYRSDHVAIVGRSNLTPGPGDPLPISWHIWSNVVVVAWMPRAGGIEMAMINSCTKCSWRTRGMLWNRAGYVLLPITVIGIVHYDAISIFLKWFEETRALPGGKLIHAEAWDWLEK